MGRAYTHDAIPQYRYRVYVSGGYLLGEFSEVVGLSAEFEEARYPSPGNKSIQKIPGRLEVSDVTCRSGVVRGDSYITEFVMTSKLANRSEVTITMLDRNGKPARQWTLEEAWIKRWEGPDLDGSSSDVAVEAVVFACENIRED